MNKIEFPQPMVEAPEARTLYYYVRTNGSVCEYLWCFDKIDNEVLLSGNVYLTIAEAKQRAAWNAQQMARLVMPAWFRELGPDVEQKCTASDWISFCVPPHMFDWTPRPGIDFSVNGVNYRKENFRAKPRDVVVTVNGKEYRWPQTVTTPTKEIIYIVRDGDVFACQCNRVGNYVHHARAGAGQQLAAIKAAAGEQ